LRNRRAREKNDRQDREEGVNSIPYNSIGSTTFVRKLADLGVKRGVVTFNNDGCWLVPNSANEAIQFTNDENNYAFPSSPIRDFYPIRVPIVLGLEVPSRKTVALAR
jgi:hypothetical protein